MYGGCGVFGIRWSVTEGLFMRTALPYYASPDSVAASAASGLKELVILGGQAPGMGEKY